MTRVRTVAMSGGAGLVLLLSACGNGPPAASGGATANNCIGKGGGSAPATVKIQATDQDQFAPTTMTAKVGDIIEWTNVGTQAHNVTFDDCADATGDLTGGSKFQVTVVKAGSYDYHCTIHPQMTAKLTVT